MRRLFVFLSAALLAPTLATAQTAAPSASAQPAPPMPAPMPEPAAAPMPLVPVPVPLQEPQVIVPPVPLAAPDVMDPQLKEQLDEQLQNLRSQMDIQRDATRAAAEDARMQAVQMRLAALQDDKSFVFNFDIRGNDGTYEGGLAALQQHQYDRAITAFDRVIAAKGPRADGALYWKAFAEYKLAKTDDALAAIAALRTGYPQSRYLGDAKVLEVDVRKSAGQPVNLDALAADEEIKILAIQGIQKSDPARAVPLLEGVLTASNPLRVKKEAIYVLALSDDPHAHEVLLRYAKGAGNPDLQSEAIRYLASGSDKQTTSADLKAIYQSSTDPDVRRAVIDAYRMAGDKASLIAIASGPGPVIAAGGVASLTDSSAAAARGRLTTIRSSDDMRGPAINALSGLAAPQDLWSLYQQEPDADLRVQIIGVLGSMGATDDLVQAAKTDKDANVRARAIRMLGARRNDANAQTLVDLYGSTPDKDTKTVIIDSLGSMNAAEALVALAKKETNLDLKRDIVRRLSDMAPRSKAAADYLMDVIK